MSEKVLPPSRGIRPGNAPYGIKLGGGRYRETGWVCSGTSGFHTCLQMGSCLPVKAEISCCCGTQQCLNFRPTKK